VSGDADSVREDLAAFLTSSLPAGWKIVSSTRNIDVSDQIIVQIKHQKMKRLQYAPIGHMEHELTITISSPMLDRDRAEDELDVGVVELVTHLDTLSSLGWTEATKAVVDDQQRIGWDVTVQLLSRPTQKPLGETP
jgi:hypothetical protein